MIHFHCSVALEYLKPQHNLSGLNGEPCSPLMTHHFSGCLYGCAFAMKATPVEWINNWLSNNPPNCPNKYLCLDSGGKLGKSRFIFVKPPAMPSGAQLQARFWLYTFYHPNEMCGSELLNYPICPNCAPLVAMCMSNQRLHTTGRSCQIHILESSWGIFAHSKFYVIMTWRAPW